jgi:dephospho-CoA kinase
MKIIGLTGSIGMGKSTLATQLASLGAQICSADAIVHALLATGGAAVAEVEKHFPETVKQGSVDRKALGAIVFADVEKRKILERILHPLVVAEENRFIAQQRTKGTQWAVLEIPLLFETGAQSRCDYTIVATAPYLIQKHRVMKRPHMTREKFAQIVGSQMSDKEKKARADFIVQTGLGKAYSLHRLKYILASIDHA